MTAIALDNRALFNPAGFSAELIKSLEEKVKFFEANQAEQLFLPMFKQKFAFSTEEFADQIRNILKAVKDGKTIRAVDMDALCTFITPVGKERDEAAVLSGSASSIVYPSTDWPKKGVFPGATVVLGQMYAGKTYHIVNKMDVDVIIRHGEPQEIVDREAGTLQSTDTLNAICKAMLLGFMGNRVAIDSFRKLIFSLTGPAMAGGITATIFDLLTNVNNLFAAIGTNVVITINPMMKDADAVERFFVYTGASTAGTILLEDRRIVNETFRTVDGRTLGSPEGGIQDDQFDRDAMTMGPRKPIDMRELEDERPGEPNGMNWNDPSPSQDETRETREGVRFNL